MTNFGSFIKLKKMGLDEGIQNITTFDKEVWEMSDEERKAHIAKKRELDNTSII